MSKQARVSCGSSLAEMPMALVGLTISWLTARDVLVHVRATFSRWKAVKAHQDEQASWHRIPTFIQRWVPVLHLGSLVRLAFVVKATQVSSPKCLLPPLCNLQVLCLLLDDDDGQGFTIAKKTGLWSWVLSLPRLQNLQLSNANKTPTLSFDPAEFDFDWRLDQLCLESCVLAPSFDCFLGATHIRVLKLDHMLDLMEEGEEAARLGALLANPNLQELDVMDIDRDLFPLLGSALKRLHLTLVYFLDQVSMCKYLTERGQGLEDLNVDYPVSDATVAAFPMALRHLSACFGSDGDEAWAHPGKLLNLETLTIRQKRIKEPPLEHLHTLQRLRELSLHTFRAKNDDLRRLCESLPALQRLYLSWPTSQFRDEAWFARFKIND